MYDSLKHAAFVDELEKISARAGLKLIRRLIAKGGEKAMASAQRLAKKPGVLKASKPGSQIKHLGIGNEATANLVADPTHGIAVRKIYDPLSGVASPKMIGRKMQMAKDMGSNPLLAKTKGFRRSDTGARMSFHEFSPGRTDKAVSKVEELALRNKLQSSARKKGWELADVRAANISGGKSIDSIPLRAGEFTGDAATLGGNLTNRVTKRFQRSPSMMKQVSRQHGVDKGTLVKGVTGKQIDPSKIPVMQRWLDASKNDPDRIKRMRQLLGGGSRKGFANSSVVTGKPVVMPKPLPIKPKKVTSTRPLAPPKQFKMPVPTGQQSAQGTAILG